MLRNYALGVERLTDFANDCDDSNDDEHDQEQPTQGDHVPDDPELQQLVEDMARTKLSFLMQKELPHFSVNDHESWVQKQRS